MNGKRIRCEFGTGCDTEVSDFGYLYVDSSASIISVSGDRLLTQGPNPKSFCGAKFWKC